MDVNNKCCGAIECSIVVLIVVLIFIALFGWIFYTEKQRDDRIANCRLLEKEFEKRSLKYDAVVVINNGFYGGQMVKIVDRFFMVYDKPCYGGYKVLLKNGDTISVSEYEITRSDSSQSTNL